MTASLFLLLLGLLILTAGAEFLVRGASVLALRLGLTPLVIGLTVVAFGTSDPELAVSLRAALAGSGQIVVGNIVGSNTFNVAVILGLTAMIFPIAVKHQVLRRDMPLMLVASLLFLVFLGTGNGVDRAEAACLVAGIVAYTGHAILAARRETSAAASAGESSNSSGSPVLAVTLVLVGLGLLVLGARLMIDHAVILAGFLGMSEAVVGLTIVAASTSMPELATSLVAAARRETEIAIGNIVGSNLFNLLCIGGVTGLVAPPLPSNGIGLMDAAFMLGTSWSCSH